MTNPVGRPRKIHSRHASAASARVFTSSEKVSLEKILLNFGIDDDQTSQWIAHLQDLCNSFHAHEDALSTQRGVTVSKEQADLASIGADATRLIAMVTQSQEQIEPRECLQVAGLLAKRLAFFPHRVEAELTRDPRKAIAFMNSRQRLAESLHFVRLWGQRRSQITEDLNFVIEIASSSFDLPRSTKRYRSARHRFEAILRTLYGESVHPSRVEVWTEVRAANPGPKDPSPQYADKKFARAILASLNVGFETKKRAS